MVEAHKILSGKLFFIERKIAKPRRFWENSIALFIQTKKCVYPLIQQSLFGNITEGKKPAILYVEKGNNKIRNIIISLA